MAYLSQAKQEALPLLKDLSSQLNIEKEDQQDTKFVNNALEFVQSIIATLDRVEIESKWLEGYLDLILSTGKQVAQIVSSQMLINVVSKASQEMESVLDGSVPDDIRHHYDELEGPLAEASKSIKEIQASCKEIMDVVTKACRCNRSNSETVRYLKANLLSTSADIRKCEKTVSDALGAIEKLKEGAKKEAWKQGFDFLATAAEVWMSGSATGLYSVVTAVGKTVYYRVIEIIKGNGMWWLINIGRILYGYTNYLEKVNVKSNQYLQISNSMESLQKMVETEKEKKSRSSSSSRKRGARGCLFACCICKSEE